MAAEPEAEPQPPLPAVPTVEAQPSVWARIQEHKLLQWTLAYAGAALAIAQAQELMAAAFGWPPAVGRIVMALLVLGVPLVLTLAWYHGHKGLKQIAAGELMVVSVLLLVLGGGFVLLVRAPEPATAATANSPSPIAPPATDGTTDAAPAKPRLAILPFENLSPDQNNVVVADGMHEEILSTLANRTLGQLDVISRTTMMTFRGRSVTLTEVASALAGTTHVLEGAVRREGQELRLTLRLIDARADRQVWTQQFNRTVTNALTMQSEVAATVASQLSVEFAGDASVGGVRLITTDREAHDLYLQAKLNAPPLQADRNRFEEPLLALDQAIARDPGFVQAYLERMRLHYLLFNGNHDSSDARLELIRASLDSLVKVAPDDPAVVWAQGHWNCLNENYELALQQFESAEAAGFNGPYPYHATCLFYYTGRYEESLPILERAIALDPRNPDLLAIYGATAAIANRPMDVLRASNLGLTRMPDALAGPSLRAFLLYRFAGDSREWLELAEQALSTGVGSSIFDQDASLRQVVGALMSQQRYDEARTFLDRAPDLLRWWGEGLQHVGKTPAAHFRGWLEMLAEDEQAAMNEGRRLVEFVRQQEVTRWNRWYLRLLNAEGLLFSGDPEGAREAARDVVGLAGESQNRSVRAMAQSMAAQVLAWAGAEEEAVSLLETLATSSPGLAPAQITREPAFSVPLANNARYQALRTRLEAQMAALQLQ